MGDGVRGTFAKHHLEPCLVSTWPSASSGWLLGASAMAPTVSCVTHLRDQAIWFHVRLMFFLSRVSSLRAAFAFQYCPVPRRQALQRAGQKEEKRVLLFCILVPIPHCTLPDPYAPQYK